MQYTKKWFECNDGGIGFGHEMSVGRVDVIVLGIERSCNDDGG